MTVCSVVLHHFTMRAALHDRAPLQYDNLVAVADGGKPMGDDQAGAAAVPDIFQHDLFRNRVEGAGSFIQH